MTNYFASEEIFYRRLFFSLLTIYKSFIRSHLDYSDSIYDQAYIASFQQKVESIQYDASLAIKGAIRGTSKEKLFEKQALESLQHMRWHKISNCQSSKYLFNINPKLNRPNSARNANNIPHFKVKDSFFKYTFFHQSLLNGPWNLKCFYP